MYNLYEYRPIEQYVYSLQQKYKITAKQIHHCTRLRFSDGFAMFYFIADK